MKKELIIKIGIEIQAMRSIFEEMKIKQTMFDHVFDVEAAETTHLDVIREAYNWVHDVFTNEYAKVLSVRKLLSEELWERYKKWGGFEEHRESKMLNEALAALRKKLIMKFKPVYLIKGGFYAESRKHKSSKSTSDRTHETGKKSRKRSNKSVSDGN